MERVRPVTQQSHKCSERSQNFRSREGRHRRGLTNSIFELRSSKLAAILIVTILAAAHAACRSEGEPGGADQPQEGAPPKPPDLLVFPEELRVADASVNEFIEHAMAECASGDYERFRLLWSADEQPLSRGEYEQGWQAVEKIRIQAVEQAYLSSDKSTDGHADQPVYAVLAKVELDPEHRVGRREPKREAVLMIVYDQQAWRLAHAPTAMRDWIKHKAEHRDAAPAKATEPTTQDGTSESAAPTSTSPDE